jgi:hypothetical protein
MRKFEWKLTFSIYLDCGWCRQLWSARANRPTFISTCWSTILDWFCERPYSLTSLYRYWYQNSIHKWFRKSDRTNNIHIDTILVNSNSGILGERWNCWCQLLCALCAVNNEQIPSLLIRLLEINATILSTSFFIIHHHQLSTLYITF